MQGWQLLLFKDSFNFRIFKYISVKSLPMKVFLMLVFMCFFPKLFAQTDYLDENKIVIIFDYVTPDERLITVNQYSSIVGKTDIKKIQKITNLKSLGVNGRTLTIEKEVTEYPSMKSKIATLYYELAPGGKSTEVTFRIDDTAIPVQLIFSENVLQVKYIGGLSRYNPE